MKTSSSACRGVSLVELSIVIVIIALLAGVVTGGLSIRKSSELRGVMSDVEAFRVAVEGFDQKYRDLPGDMTDAANYWGSACDSTASNCNGNGNGQIELGSDADSESFRFWQHLKLSGFLEGGYTGSGTGTTHVPGVNCPATKRDKGGYHVRTHTDDTDTVSGTQISAGAYLASNWTAGALFTAAEVASMDEKTDDGKPDAGKTKGRYYNNGSAWQTSTCLTGTYPNRTYNKTRTEPECLVYFKLE